MEQYPTVLYELKGNVALITLNRPEVLNAINRQLKEELGKVIAQFDADDEARVAVLTGAGRAFSAGRDLKERASDNDAGIQAKAVDSIAPQGFHGMLPPKKPLIAAINGHCLAGGFSIAQMCDIRIASETAQIGILEPRAGLMAPFGTILPRLIPAAYAMELLLTAKPVTAQRAREMGFVNYVVPPEALIGEALAMADMIAANAPLSVLYSKELAYRSLDLDDGTLHSLLVHTYDKLLESEDAKEGPKAFADKRAPEWKGR